jgi:hypothetical protein
LAFPSEANISCREVVLNFTEFSHSNSWVCGPHRRRWIEKARWSKLNLSPAGKLHMMWSKFGFLIFLDCIKRGPWWKYQRNTTRKTLSTIFLRCCLNRSTKHNSDLSIPRLFSSNDRACSMERLPKMALSRFPSCINGSKMRLIGLFYRDPSHRRG